MPKVITIEQVEAMSADQRNTLHKNALALDTPAARAVIEMLANGDLMRAPVKKSVAAKPRASKSKVAVHGRQT